METVHGFHDSCIKEMKYVGGAYVDDNLSMYPLNTKQKLNVIIQTQWEGLRSIEPEISGLEYLKLCPASEEFTCEILDFTLLLNGGSVLWFDRGGMTAADLSTFEGTAIKAAGLRWRIV